VNTDNPFAAMLPVAMGKLDQIATLDQKLVKFHGTMAEWQNKAATAIDSTTMSDTLSAWNMTASDWATEFLGPIVAIVKSDSATVLDFFGAVVGLADNTKQYRDDCITAFIRSGMGTTDEAGLVAQREALVKEVDAFRLVLTDQNIDGADKLVVPDAPKPARKGGGQPKGASKYLRFYRLDADGPVYPADSQQKASSVAWYQFGASIEAMESAMRSAGWNGQYTTPWSGQITVTSKDGTKQTTKTIGWDVTTEADQTTDSDNQSDGEVTD
jgi:hypothetical protein